jgi:peptide/nickel transport system ATP-binding protein
LAGVGFVRLPLRKSIEMVFQDPSLNPRFTPRARSSIRFRGLGDIRERDALGARC